MNEKQLLKKLVSIRREIHKNPELGDQEFKTARFTEKILKKLRIPFQRVSTTGIVATLIHSPSSPPSPAKGGGIKGGARCIALRADMDALPLTEKSKKPYCSKNPGVMHACGHDAHVSMLLGAAMLLSEKRDFNGTVKFFFQPNEEGGGGAKKLIEAGAMKNPKVDAVFGLHVNPRFSTGTIAIKEGPLMAAVDKFEIEVIGSGGHAAYPHEGKDAIRIASEVVQSLQTIVSRRIDPLEPAVVTVGTIQGGTRFNILADRVQLTGTVRTLSETLHRKMPRMIRQIVSGVCQAGGAKFKLNYEVLGSVLSNSAEMAELAKQAAVSIFGKKAVMTLERASMGGEDFAEYLKYAPGCFIYVGTGNSKLKTTIPWHHPEFEIDERALSVGANLLAGLARKFLKGQ